jgi:hypothetical protein
VQDDSVDVDVRRASLKVAAGVSLLVLGVIAGVSTVASFGPWPAPFGSQCVTRDVPRGALISESAAPAPSFSWWPLGVACAFPASNGQGQVTSAPPWDATGWMVGSVGGIAVGSVIIATSTARPRLTSAAAV